MNSFFDTLQPPPIVDAEAGMIKSMLASPAVMRIG
jgi:hypothetical protein